LKLFNFLIKNNIWIALISLSNVVYFQLIFSGKVEVTYALVVFTGTLFIYNLHRYLKKSNTIRIIEIINENKSLILFAILSVLFIVFDFVGLRLVDIPRYSPVILLLFALGSAGTIIYLLSSRMELPWKKYTIIKPLSLTVIWFLLVALIPLIHHTSPWEHWGKLTHFFLVLFAICLVFDIKDLDIDRQGHINTIANVYGVQFTRRFALVLLVLSILVTFFIHASWNYRIGLMGISLLTMFAIKNVNEQNKSDYYYLWLDGLLGLFLPVLLICGL